MRLLQIQDIDLEVMAAALDLNGLPVITRGSDRRGSGVRRRQGLRGPVYFGGEHEPARWEIAFKPNNDATRDAILTALTGDLDAELRLVAKEIDASGTRVAIDAALVKINEVNARQFVAVLESVDSVWTAESAEETAKTFLSGLDLGLPLVVPGTTRTHPRIVLMPLAQRTVFSATAGWTFRRRYTVTNNSDVDWFRLPISIDLGDTTPLTTTKAQASGDDLRVVIDGLERQRTLVSWDTVVSRVWCILPALPAGESKTVEVWYGNPSATNPPVLAYPHEPPFTLATSTNAQWIYPTDDIAANAGKGAWRLSKTTPGAVPDFAVPGAFRVLSTFERPDNEDAHAQETLREFVDTTTWVQAVFSAFRGGSLERLAAGFGASAQTNPYDGVALYHPLGISSVNVGFGWTNGTPGPSALVILGRGSAAESWVQFFTHNTLENTEASIAAATQTPTSPVRHVAFAVWPANFAFIAVDTFGVSRARWNTGLTVNIDTTDLSITGGTEAEVFELATTLRLGGGVDATAPYDALLVGNAKGASGEGTPRVAVKIVTDPECLVLDGRDRTAEVWDTTDSEPWTPAALPNLRAWYKADAITGIADEGSVATWPDSGPGEFAATQGTADKQPTYESSATINGLPSVEFAGGNDVLATALTASVIEQSVLAVIDRSTSATVRVMLGSAADGGRTFRLNTTHNLQIVVAGGATIATGSNTVGSGVNLVSVDLGATTWGLGINGTLETGSHGATLTAGLTSLIGNNAGGNQGFDSRMAELVVCDLLVTADRQRVEGYLAWKWGLQASLPGGHPYGTAAPTLPLPGVFVETAPTHAIRTVTGFEVGG